MFSKVQNKKKKKKAGLFSVSTTKGVKYRCLKKIKVHNS